MKKRNKVAVFSLALFYAPAFILLDPAYALANQPPGGNSVMSLLLEVILLIGLTLAAGGYGVFRRMDASKSKFARIFKNALGIIVGTLVFLFGAVNVGAALFALIVFSIYGVVRGVQMIRWGRAAKKSPRPVYLDGVNPGRLLASGIALIVLTPMIFGYGILSIGESQQPYKKRGLAYQINSEARSAYNAAQTYLADNPKAVEATCADIEKTGYKIPHIVSCQSDMTLNSGGITITGPESWGLSNPSATVSYSGELTPARP